MWLLLVAFVGLIIGDGLFFYWLVYDFNGFRSIMQDRLALAFMIDAVLTLGILTVHFARTPPGRIRWPWFLILSLIGGLCFGLPFYWWLNKRGGATAALTAT
jgi:hypothetical protein